MASTDLLESKSICCCTYCGDLEQLLLRATLCWCYGESLTIQVGVLGINRTTGWEAFGGAYWLPNKCTGRSVPGERAGERGGRWAGETIGCYGLKLRGMWAWEPVYTCFIHLTSQISFLELLSPYQEKFGDKWFSELLYCSTFYISQLYEK